MLGLGKRLLVMRPLELKIESRKVCGWTRTQAGFTLIEIMVAVAIMGLLGSFSLFKLSAFLQRQSLIGEGKALLAYLHEARAYGLKKGIQVGISFNATSSTYTLFEDLNGNSRLDAGEAVRTQTLAKNIVFGSPTNGPTQGPGGVTVPTNGLQGAWGTALIYPLDMNTSLSAGMAYLQRLNLKKVTFCLQSNPTTQKLTALLWEGSTWKSL
jgi:prepilin-type N-terminal cleavage/methylation domain-containing protein